MIPTPPPTSWASGSDPEFPSERGTVMMMHMPERPQPTATTTSSSSSTSTTTTAAAAAAAAGSARSSSSDRTATASSPPAGMRIRPSKTEWEANKPTIIRLYMDEDLSLKEVMHLMVTEHGMRGTTEKMFKQRLRKWGCRKNISLKREDEETLRRLFEQGEQQGPEGLSPPHQQHHHHPHPQQHRHRSTGRDIRLANGQVTTVDRLATHLRRKQDYYGRRQSGLPPSDASSPASRQLQQQRKLPNPLRVTLPDPQTFRVSEAVLYQVRTFIISRFPDQRSAIPQLGADGPSLVVQWRSYKDWLAYCNRIGVALRRHRLDEALREMRHGPEGITTILRAISGDNQIPNVLGMLFYFLITVTRHQSFLTPQEKRQLFVVVRALVKYAAQVSAQDGLPEIIVRMLHSIWFVDDDEMLYDLSNKAWQMTCQTWGSKVPGPGAGGGEQQQLSSSSSLMTTPSPSPSPSSSSSSPSSPSSHNKHTDGKKIAASWANIFSPSSSPSPYEDDDDLLPPRTDLVIADAMAQLSRRTYADLLILHSSYLHAAIAAQGRNPSLDDRLLSVFKVISGITQDPSHLTSVITQLLLAYHYRGDWDAVERYKPSLWWALRNAPNDYLRVWAVLTVRGHVANLAELAEAAAGEGAREHAEALLKAERMAGWLAELESMQWGDPASHELTPPPDLPDDP